MTFWLQLQKVFYFLTGKSRALLSYISVLKDYLLWVSLPRQALAEFRKSKLVKMKIFTCLIISAS